jgi:hypothetical protein
MAASTPNLPGIHKLNERLLLVLESVPWIRALTAEWRMELLAGALGVRKSTCYKIKKGTQDTYKVLGRVKKGLLDADGRYRELSGELRNRVKERQWIDFCAALRAGVDIEQLINEFGLTNPDKATDPSLIWMAEPQRVVEDFFRKVSEQRLTEAWELIAPQFRDEFWADNFAHFQNGYRNSRETALVHLEAVPSESLANVQFVAHATIRCKSLIPTFRSLEGLGRLPFTESGLRQLRQRLRQFKAEVRRLGCKNPKFEAINLWLAARPASGDAM